MVTEQGLHGTKGTRGQSQRPRPGSAARRFCCGCSVRLRAVNPRPGPRGRPSAGPAGAGACAYIRGILMALTESREIRGQPAHSTRWGKWGSHGHVSISTAAPSEATTLWSTEQGGARKHRPEPRGLGTLLSWRRALTRSVLYKKNPGHWRKDK